MGSKHPLDRQSAAYREMTEQDRIPDDELFEFAEKIHTPSSEPIHGPEWWEEGEGWDTGRETPKTVEEAEQALAARIADDTASDTADHAGVYREADN